MTLAEKIVEKFEVCRQDGKYTILLGDVPMQVVLDRGCPDRQSSASGGTLSRGLGH